MAIDPHTHHRSILRRAINNGPYFHISGRFPTLRATEDVPGTFPINVTPLGLMLEVASNIAPQIYGNWCDIWDGQHSQYPGQARWDWANAQHEEPDDITELLELCYGLTKEQLDEIESNSTGDFSGLVQILDMADSKASTIDLVLARVDDIYDAIKPLTHSWESSPDLLPEVARQAKHIVSQNLGEIERLMEMERSEVV